MTEPIDLTDGRSISTTLGGRPVHLTPMEDGTIALTEHPGRPPRFVPMSELGGKLVRNPFSSAAPDLGSDPSPEELKDALAALRSAPAPAADEEVVSLSDTADEGDPADLSDDEIYSAWERARAAEQGIDLAESSAGPTLKPGDAVEWGSGYGVAHGIVQEVDTATGSANVHTAEVVEAGGAGEQLSPTGITIKIDGAKLRKSRLKVIGEEPVGPELSGDLSDDPGAGTDAESDDSFFRRVMRALGGSNA